MSVVVGDGFATSLVRAMGFEGHELRLNFKGSRKVLCRRTVYEFVLVTYE